MSRPRVESSTERRAELVASRRRRHRRRVALRPARRDASGRERARDRARGSDRDGPLLKVDLGLLAHEVGETPADTLDARQREHDLLAAIDVRVEDTEDVLELVTHNDRLRHGSVHWPRGQPKVRRLLARRGIGRASFTGEGATPVVWFLSGANCSSAPRPRRAANSGKVR